MADQIERIADLMVKAMNGSLTPDESAELEAWKAASPENLQGFNDRTNQTELLEKLVHYQNAEDDKEEMKSRIPWESVIRKPTNSNLPINWRKLSVAASILVVLSLAAFFWIGRSKKAALEIKDSNRIISKNDVPAPTGTRTILTLGNGAQVVLDSVQNGTLARQGSASVAKVNGQLVYNTVLHEKSAEIMYNTLSTAKGGQTMIVLADGSKVWLNAASSIRFPAVFVGKERAVQLTGEAYFEIAKNADKPFNVQVNGIKVEVLGTRFNVNAYNDEPNIKTTLLEGSVKVLLPLGVGINKGDDAGKRRQEVTLKPGQEAQVDQLPQAAGLKTNQGGVGKIKVANNTDVEEAISWKNGMTSFKDADIKSIMRKVSKWYDVDVVYKGEIPERTFMGAIPRSASLSDLLRVLEISDVHFEIEGKKITVMK